MTGRGLSQKIVLAMKHVSRRQSRTSRAFTLLELLAMVVIVSVMATTLLPSLARSRPVSRSFQCLTNNRRLCNAWRMYADDNRDRMVFASGDGTGTQNPLNQYAWTLAPSDSNPANRGNWDITYDLVKRPLWPYSGQNAAIYRCPSDPSSFVVNRVPRPRIRGMSMNLYLGGFAGTTGGWPQINGFRIFLKATELGAPGPAETFVFLDQRWDTANWGNFFTDMSGYPNNPSAYQIRDFPNMIHENACGFSFADGRVEMRRWLDPRTTPVLGPASSTYPPFPSPRNPDVAWLQDHATRPK
jgi:type II secretory pathway pseudopilin PulG